LSTLRTAAIEITIPISVSIVLPHDISRSRATRPRTHLLSLGRAPVNFRRRNIQPAIPHSLLYSSGLLIK
jgi:hypothetical protein